MTVTTPTSACTKRARPQPPKLSLDLSHPSFVETDFEHTARLTQLHNLLARLDDCHVQTYCYTDLNVDLLLESTKPWGKGYDWVDIEEKPYSPEIGCLPPVGSIAKAALGYFAEYCGIGKTSIDKHHNSLVSDKLLFEL